MKYKVGDKARVRSDLVVNGTYPKGECRFIPSMSPFIGKEITIKGIHPSGIRYLIEENSDFWSDEMLEDVEEKFKLPEDGRWCVKATKENISILGDYWDKGCGLRKVYSHEYTIRNDVGKYWCSYNLASGSLLFSDSPGSNYTIKEKPNGLLEITFDQFKKYVLKSETTSVKEEVKFDAGKWYKVLNNWWGKFETIHNSGKRIKFSESITSSGKYDTTSKNIDIISELELLTNLSEIQQYLPEGHPDKLKKRTKKVEDLKYPDAVHCSSKEEHDKVKQFANIGDYEGDYYYLLGAQGRREKPWDGRCGSNQESRTTYTNYEFSDIIFPEEKIVNKEDDEFKIGAYIVFTSDFGSSKKGDVDKIKTVYGPEQIMLEKEGISWGRLGEGFSKRCKYFLTLEEAQRFSDELLCKNKVEAKPILSKEELLAEAKRRYPVGTKYKCANGIHTPGNEECFEITHGDELRFFEGSRQKIDAIGRGFVYYVGKWAEIISEPAVEESLKYVECIGLEEVNVMFWSQYFTIGEIYLAAVDDGTTTFRINGIWCDKSQFKPSTKEAFEKQNESNVQKIGSSSERYAITLDPFDAESSSDGIEVGKLPLDRSMGFYEQMEKMNTIEMALKLPPMGWIYNPYGETDYKLETIDSDEIYVPIIKTEVKQIKL